MHPLPPPVLLLGSDEAVASASLGEHAVVAGWTAQLGFDLPAEPWDLGSLRIVCVGRVDDEADARAAITAIARGAGLAIRVALRGAAHHSFLDDLHKVATPVPFDPAVAGDHAHALAAEQETLLAALAEGATVTAAAATLHVSRRTANRMLADARARLGADSNADAVRRWVATRPSPEG